LNAAPAIGVELGLGLAGLSMIWRYVAGPIIRGERLPVALPPWKVSPSDFLLYLLLGFCGGIVCQYLFALLLTHSPLADEIRRIFLGGALDLGVLAGIAGFHIAREGVRPPVVKSAIKDFTTGGLTPSFRSGAATFLIAMPLVALVTIGWQSLLTVCGVPIERQDVVDLFVNAHSFPLRALLTIFAVVLAPVTEEIIFRRGVFRFLRGRAPRWVVLTVPAVLFGLAHWNLASFAPLVVLGFVFSLAYERTGRIGTSMVAHGLFNLNMVVLIFAGINV